MIIALLLLVVVMVATSTKIIMSKVTDSVAAVEAAFQKVSTDISAINANTKALNDQIVALQAQLANAGLSAEDSAALDQVVTDAGALVAQVDAAVPVAVSPPAAPSA